MTGAVKEISKIASLPVGATEAALGLAGGVMNPDVPEAPKPPPVPGRGNTEEVAEAERERKLRGRASTLVTGPRGLTSTPEINRKKLLGS